MRDEANVDCRDVTPAARTPAARIALGLAIVCGFGVAGEMAEARADDLTQRVQNACALAQERLLELRQPDGRWDSTFCVNGVPAAGTIVMLRTCGLGTGADSATRESRLVRHMLRQANPDGGFFKYPGSASSRSVTRIVLLALRLAAGQVGPAGRETSWFTRNPDLDPELAGALTATISRAQAFLDSGGTPGGADFELDYSILSLLLAEVVEPASGWSWRHWVPAPETLAWWGRTPGRRDAESRLSILVRRALPAAAILHDAVHATVRRGGAAWTHSRPRPAVAELVQQLRAEQGGSGGWFCSSFYSALDIMALRAAGVDPDDPTVRAGLAYVNARMVDSADGGLCLGDLDSDTWDTCMALRPLMLAGWSATDPRIRPSLEFLLASQDPDGRFSFTSGMSSDGDNDTTGLVLDTLGRAYRLSAGPFHERVGAALGRAIAGVEPYQFHGGFPAWDHALLGAGRGPLSVPAQLLLDQPTADVTARVLHGLLQGGMGADEPAIRKGVSFLCSTQCRNGGWWSRWAPGYIPATRWTLRALSSAGLRYDAPPPGDDALMRRAQAALRRGADFVVSHQNPDGGWGETTAADRDSRQAARGPSTPLRTSLALAALLDAGWPRESPAVTRGVEYLLSVMTPDGQWQDDQVSATVIAGIAYYRYPLHNRVMPLYALTQYLDTADGGR